MLTSTTPNKESIRLTQFSPGAGCGCKISPAVLDQILKDQDIPDFPGLLVGNNTRDDAAVVDWGDGQALVSTTDFFMPIVDDPFDFGYIAAVNAISDIYAMGGEPLVAIAILGWPINKLSATIAGQVVAGGRAACTEAGIALAGGHSIDASEPIFGLAVTGRVATDRLKKNSDAKAGDQLFLTKPLGVGIFSTAEKKSGITEQQAAISRRSMKSLNHLGPVLAAIPGVHAMTDVTGFGLLGHLLELCRAADLKATLDYEAIPFLNKKLLEEFVQKGFVPGGTRRNFASYGSEVGNLSDLQRDLLADPQTSGGLLVSVASDAVKAVQSILRSAQCPDQVIGTLEYADQSTVRIQVNT